MLIKFLILDYARYYTCFRVLIKNEVLSSLRNVGEVLNIKLILIWVV